MARRVFVIVLDSFGVGHAPDADKFGDEGANTLKTIYGSSEYHTPNMEALGLLNIDGIDYADKVELPIGSYGRMQEVSQGKDTTIGHWEIAGIISEKPLPTYPDGFPEEIIEKLKAATGRGILCNKPYSGTAVINDYGDEHVRTGDLIVYTSADSVLQIAAHEDVVSVETLYKYCEMAREIMQGVHGVGRIIARPFTGSSGSYERTAARHDYSLVPPADTMMDVLVRNGFDTLGVGKIYDIFAGKNIQRTVRITDNVDGMRQTLKFQREEFEGLCFVNLVDFDMKYGHRRAIDDYAFASTVFDGLLGTFMDNMREEDILFITADHGCDPGYSGTDHTREMVPVLVYGRDIQEGVNLGTRGSFADVAATIEEIFGLEVTTQGSSFAKDILK